MPPLMFVTDILPFIWKPSVLTPANDPATIVNFPFPVVKSLFW